VPFKVLIDDNFHYRDETARSTRGEFETLDAAVAACRAIVDDFLESAYMLGMRADDLIAAYVIFGDDPWISGADGIPFSGRDYARGRCREICGQDPDQG
jgi:hypothetical protein